MDKRYQVFVSSTYEDLQEERQEVMHALLELDCIPSGMELFPAANESQWALIKRVIEECDYYVLILAGRYGSCDSDGTSYTEKEYHYAHSIGKPIIAFLHKDPSDIPVKKYEATREGRKRLSEFRAVVEKRLCKLWSTPAELGSVVSRSLVQLIKSTPAIGWVRADELPDKNAAIELLRLRQRVEELESELTRLRTTAPKGSEELAQGEEHHKIRFGFTARSEELDLHPSVYSDAFQSTWNNIFGAVAPIMINEASEHAVKVALNSFVHVQNSNRLRKDDRFKHVILADFDINDEDYQTIKIQLRALGLITRSERTRSVRDNETYWTLTPYGDETMTRLRAIKRAAVSEAPEVSKPRKRKD